MEVAIGVDPSKSSLAVAAVDPLGRVVGTAEFSNDPRGHGLCSDGPVNVVRTA